MRLPAFLTLLLLCLSAGANQPRFDFRLYQKDTSPSEPTLLIIGGIQGDEPGGFNAAALLATRYHITRGNLWVVPNLNFESIIKRSRGVYGDMNRKFLHLDRSDPEYELVQKIKAIIQDPRIDMVLNLHDGSGFYRPQYQDRLHGPQRWGQSIIIDQARVETPRFGELQTLAETVRRQVNRIIRNPEAHYHVRNTRTREGDREMEKTLTYFSIRKRKPAFGLEVSKEYPTHERVYYHLLLVEAFMQQLGIGFERPFALQQAAIRNVIDNDIKLSLNNRKVYLDVANARRRLGYVPLQKSAPLELDPGNPLLALVTERQGFRVRYGNRHVTWLHPQYFTYDSSLEQVALEIDGQPRTVELGNRVRVRQSFKVDPLPGYRVNVIGFRRAGVKNEAGIAIRRQDIASRFSVDRAARLYRVEFYREDKYCGMLLLDFSDHQTAGRAAASDYARLERR